MSAPPRTFEQKLLATVRRYRMLEPGERVLVAVSGGQDSLALLDALSGLRERLAVTVLAAHLNHGIRGAEAEADARFVAEFGERLGVPVVLGEAEVPELAKSCGLSLEHAGREARYGFLREVAAKQGCAKIAVGHTRTDRAETVLMNVLRGSGLDGLRGIPPVNGQVVRPLIGHSREETGTYCRERGLEPRVDRTNQEVDGYLRNRVRLKLMPLLVEEYSPGVEEALVRLAEAVEEEVVWTGPMVDAALAEVCERDGEALRIGLAELSQVPDGLVNRLLLKCLQEACGGTAGVLSAHVQALRELVEEGKPGSRAALPFEVCAKRGYNALVLARQEAREEGWKSWKVELEVPGEVRLPVGGSLRAQVQECPPRLKSTPHSEALVKVEAAGRELVVRSWQPGDRVQPLGMTGHKKLQDCFVNAKVPRADRHRVPVVTDAKGTVLWVGGVVVGQQGRLHPEDTRCVRLTWTPPEGVVWWSGRDECSRGL
ncbi:MAG: tRNA lysidine(34) synthetase TilS [Armatimonadia bacterium]